MAIGDQNKPWEPHVVCGTCLSNLAGRLNGFRRGKPFVVPRV